MKTVLVFRTSVGSASEVQKLEPLLNKLFQNDDRWNFDLLDRENILRVESDGCGALPVIGLLKSEGYYCEELDD